MHTIGEDVVAQPIKQPSITPATSMGTSRSPVCPTWAPVPHRRLRQNSWLLTSACLADRWINQSINLSISLSLPLSHSFCFQGSKTSIFLKKRCAFYSICRTFSRVVYDSRSRHCAWLLLAIAAATDDEYLRTHKPIKCAKWLYSINLIYLFISWGCFYKKTLSSEINW